MTQKSLTGPDDGGTLLIRFLLAVYAEPPRQYVVKYRRVRRKHPAIRHSTMHGSLKEGDVGRLLAYFGLGMMLLLMGFGTFLLTGEPSLLYLIGFSCIVLGLAFFHITFSYFLILCRSRTRSPASSSRFTIGQWHQVGHGYIEKDDMWRLLLSIGMGSLLIYYLYNIFWGP
jgi:hypothetical protein